MFSSFRASLNILSGKKSSSKYYEFSPDISVNGAYKTSADEFFGTRYQPHNRSEEDAIPHTRPHKSTSDLTKPNPPVPAIRTSVPEVSTDPRGAEHRPLSNISNNNVKPKKPERESKKKAVKENNVVEKDINLEKEAKKAEKEAKKLEKQRLAEQKERDKQAAIEQAKLKKERDRNTKLAKQDNAKSSKNKKTKAEAPPPPKLNPLAQGPYSTNTLDSSISKTSGPPPYSEDTPILSKNENRGESSNKKNARVERSNDTLINHRKGEKFDLTSDHIKRNGDRKKDENKDETITKSGNITFSKPIDEGSWDMIMQHKQQISRPTNVSVMNKTRKTTVMDLKYGYVDDVDNSEA